jgi:hypothetical protein
MMPLTGSNDQRVYAEKIERVDRKISREEMEELIQIMEVTKFADFQTANFIVASDGIYFIDTEYKSFTLEQEWGKASRLEVFLDAQDEHWFMNIIHEKGLKYPKKTPLDVPSLYELAQWHVEQKICKSAGVIYMEPKEYSFSLDSIGVKKA